MAHAGLEGIPSTLPAGTVNGNQTITGNQTIQGTLEVSGITTLAGVTATGNVSQTGSGTFSTGTGATSLNGNTAVAVNKSLDIPTADKLTSGGNIVSTIIPITFVANALSVSSTIFIADAAYQIVGCRAVWGVAGGLGAVLDIEKCTGTTAPGSGTALLASTIDLTGTANTVATGTLTSTTSSLQLAAGNRLTAKLAGTLTGLVGCCITVLLKRI